MNDIKGKIEEKKCCLLKSIRLR